ncbi:uncharacterized protein LOC143908253 [Temnothorax americanus]|uniref:uncharacterized protein LOC143908253 n=1 Tax=Temnothorax americanus TaxID=1964332 RepID=UPI0040678DAA
MSIAYPYYSPLTFAETIEQNVSNEVFRSDAHSWPTQRILGRRPISLSLYVAGGIVIAIIICTCCCTLFVRNKCARIFNKLMGRRKKESVKAIVISLRNTFRKYFSDVEEGRKKLRKKRKRPVSPDLTYIPTEVAPIIPREPERLENGSPTPCYKCYRKKKRGRKAKRQTR